MAKRNLDADTRRMIEDKLSEITYYGTPEMGYADSGFWQFVAHVRTKDEHDYENPVKPIDVEKYEYMQVVWLHMLHLTSGFIPKSRQIRMSWAAVIFAAWFVRTAPHRLVIFQSMKEHDAQQMISMGRTDPAGGRLSVVEHNLPWWLRDYNIIGGQGNRVGELIYTPTEKGEGGVRVPWYGSRVIALPQGANQVRGKVPSLYLGDETGLWDDFRETWSATSPAVRSGKGRSKMFAFSSVYAGSQFNDAVLEGTDSNDGALAGQLNYTGIPEMKPIIDRLPGQRLPRGMRSLVTPSGTPVLEVHYSCDPDKRPETPDGKTWIDKASQDYIGGTSSPEWLREMEIDYEASGGSLVFPQVMDPRCKVWHEPLTFRDIKTMKMKLVAGYDYGSVNPAAFIVWGLTPEGKRYALWELYEPVYNYVDHCKKILACPYVASGLLSGIYCDPQMLAKDQQTQAGKTSMLELYRREGVNMRPGRKGADLTFVQLLRYWWRDMENPEAFICENCWNLKREIQRLKWEEYSGAVARRRNAPEKIQDNNNHAFDASAYPNDALPHPPSFRENKRGRFTWSDVDLEMKRDEERKKQSARYV